MAGEHQNSNPTATANAKEHGVTDYPGGPPGNTAVNVEEPEEPRRKVIYWETGDPDNPHNWSTRKKWVVSMVAILLVSNSAFASSFPSGAASSIQKDMGISSPEIAPLTISIFLVGYLVGPILFVPLSEFYGRRGISIIAFSLYLFMSIGCALAPNISVLLAFRFFMGAGASAPLSITAGQLADIWTDPVKRGRLMALYCTCTMIGPTLSPSVSGYISETKLGWRMSFWIVPIVAGISFIPLIFFCPETYGPILLLRRAERMREEGDFSAVAPIELGDRSLKSIFVVTLTRPLRMFWQESIVFFTSLFLSLLYGTFYLSFSSYPMIYQEIYGFSTGASGLFFLPLALGATLACASGMLWDTYLNSVQKRHPTRHLSPEFRRLPIGLIGGLVYCCGLFWQAWTANPQTHYMVPAMSGVPFGFGFCIVFLAFLNYLTDSYDTYSASAMAAASMCRSLLGAAFPLFARIMYERLAIPWASSLLAFAALGMSFIPILFIKYGKRIRAGSKFCQFLMDQKRIREEEERARDTPASGHGEPPLNDTAMKEVA